MLMPIPGDIERRAAELAVPSGDPLNLPEAEQHAQQVWDADNRQALGQLQTFMDQIDVAGIVDSRMPVLQELPEFQDGQLAARRFSWLPDNSAETREAKPRICAMSGAVILYASPNMFRNFRETALDVMPTSILYAAGLAIDDGSGVLFYGATQRRSQQDGEPFANMNYLYTRLTDGSYIDAIERRRRRQEAHEDAPRLVRLAQDKTGWAEKNAREFANGMATAENWVAKSRDADETKFVKANFKDMHLLPDVTMPANQDWFTAQLDEWIATDPNVRQLFPQEPKPVRPLSFLEARRLGIAFGTWRKHRREHDQG
jgi:hypothetical protein